MNDNIYSKIGGGVKVGNVVGRYILYLIVFCGMFILFILMMATGDLDVFLNKILPNDNVFLARLILFIIGLSPLFFWERSVLNFRKKHGFPLYKNIVEEIKQRAVNERVAREKKAFEINGVNQGVDKNDIGYWHGLLKSGAITEEEYEAKKKELM